MSEPGVSGPGPSAVGEVFAALADPTRRQIFESIAERGPLTASSLSRELPVSRQAISKHLERLAAAGLVDADRVGRESRWQATPDPLRSTKEWIDRVGTAWDRRLQALAGRAAQDARS